jgi:hypothetical protein
MKNGLRMRLIGGALFIGGVLLTNAGPALAQDYGYDGGYNNAPAAQGDSLVSRIALYPDPLLAQIFAAAAYPDQIAAAAQGAGGPFDPSVEALMQYPSVLQMMASDPGWLQALGQAVMEDQGAVMDAIQGLRREAQQYGYLQSGQQMQVVDDGGYIDIQPVNGYMYVPMYDPYVVFARPRPGFFVGGAIRFGGGSRWVGGYNRFNWRSHQVVVNRRVWTPVRRYSQPRGNTGWNRNYTAPAGPSRSFGQRFEQRAVTPQQRNFTREQSRGVGRQMEQRNLSAPRQMQQRTFTSQPRNQGGNRFDRGGEVRGRRR